MKRLNFVGGRGRAVACGAWLRAVAILAAALLALVPVARAQTAPAGNEQPQRKFAESSRQVDVLSAVPAPSKLSKEAKEKFAREVNISLVRDLAVFHSGRVKVLDTLARETVADITGRKDYFDLVREGGGEGGTERWRKVKYDPVFTLLDMALDRGYYDDKALIGSGYLPVRVAFLDLVFKGEANADKHESYKRLGRLYPSWVRRPSFDIVENQGSQSLEPYRKGINEVFVAMRLWWSVQDNLLMVPPDSTHEAWWNIADLPASTPAGAAWAALGKAWAEGDAATVNAQLAVLAKELPAMQPGVYPGVRRWIESTYNRAAPFEWGAWLYAVSLVTLLLAMGTGRPWLRWAGMATLAAAVGVHLIGFVARCYIAERYSIQNQFESMTGVSLFAAMVGLGLLLAKRMPVFALAAAGAGFLILITATQTAIPGKDINREAAILNTSVLLKYHVTTVLFSYGLITLGMVVSGFYLVTHYFRGGGAVAAANAVGADPANSARALNDLDKAQNTVLQLAFWTLGVGILLGAWWADHSWGRWWAFDPKELWALVTWIVYLIVVHVRVAGVKGRGLVTAWLSVAGFIAMLWCYFGVNLLLPGLHAYA